MRQVVQKQTKVDLSVADAFNAFINELTLWWPREYTWSEDNLVELSIHPVPGGHCTEKGPNDFRCDWGTVSAVKRGEYITIKWQISPFRVPEPNPLKASEVFIRFRMIDDKQTTIELRHDQFENHGAGHEKYYEGMNGNQGWEYILACFAKHAQNGSGTTAEVKL